jgi:hypothetical protein
MKIASTPTEIKRFTTPQQADSIFMLGGAPAAHDVLSEYVICAGSICVLLNHQVACRLYANHLHRFGLFHREGTNLEIPIHFWILTRSFECLAKVFYRYNFIFGREHSENAIRSNVPDAHLRPSIHDTNPSTYFETRGDNVGITFALSTLLSVRGSTYKRKHGYDGQDNDSYKPAEDH